MLPDPKLACFSQFISKMSGNFLQNDIMKRILFLSVLGLIMTSFRFQTNTEMIVSAFKSADAGLIGGNFDDFVDIKLLDKDEVKNLGRNQATIMLRSFYSDNGISGFEKISERELGTTMYIAGKLPNKGKSNNVTIMLKQKEGKYKIITLRIS
jgi:hypothetical protein